MVAAGNEDRGTDGRRHQHAAGDGAGEDRERGAGLHQCVATDEFLVPQRLREDRVLHRPEQRRVESHQEQRAQEQGQVGAHEPDRTDDHDRDLEQLDEADDARLVVLVRELTGGRRKEEERQDEERAGEVHQHIRRQRGERGGVERDQDHERVLVDVVVQDAQKLRDEKRRKAPLPEQSELTLPRHRSFPVRRDSVMPPAARPVKPDRSSVRRDKQRQVIRRVSGGTALAERARPDHAPGAVACRATRDSAPAGGRAAAVAQSGQFLM